MYPRPFRLVRVASLSEAAEALHHYGDGARLLAGGQSLIPLLKLRLSAPDVLVDLSGVARPAVSFDGGTVAIPALTVHRAVYDSEEIVSRYDVIRDAIPQIADAQVRNMGTVGGSVAEADPAGDWGPMLVALDGTIRTTSASGERRIAARQFFRGMFETALAPDEVVTSVEIPAPEAGGGGGYFKIKRRAGGYALASVAVQLTVREGKCTSVGIGCGAVDEMPVHPTEVEDLIRGEVLNDALAAEAAELLLKSVHPMSDNRGSEEYKRHLCSVLFKRGVKVAYRRALGEEVLAGVLHG